MLRVRSIMTRTTDIPPDCAGDIADTDNLESVIARSEGNTEHVYRVLRKGKAVGFLDMKDLVRALVPTEAATSRNGSSVDAA